jgi:hypothetical protein
VPEPVFEVVAEYPQEEHVAEQVREAAVHEHRDEQREVDAAGRRLESGDAYPLVRRLDADDAVGRHGVAPRHDLQRHGGPGVGETVLLGAEALEEDEDQDVGGDQQVIDQRRRRRAPRVVVADGEDHLLEPSRRAPRAPAHTPTPVRKPKLLTVFCRKFYGSMKKQP